MGEGRQEMGAILLLTITAVVLYGPHMVAAVVTRFRAARKHYGA